MIRTTQNFQRLLSAPPASQTESGQKVNAANDYRKLRQARQRNEVQRDGPAKRIDRAQPKVAEYKTESHHDEKPNEEKLFIYAHGHPPRPLASPAGPQGPAGDGSDRYAFLIGACGGSGFGALSPISRTLLSSSDTCMPESASKSAGTCAAILVMSPVSL